jgi:hypothetical protein
MVSHVETAGPFDVVAVGLEPMEHGDHRDGGTWRGAGSIAVVVVVAAGPAGEGVARLTRSRRRGGSNGLPSS